MDLALTIVLSVAVMTVAVYLYKRKAKQLGGGNLRRLKEQIRRNQLPPIPIGWFAAFPSLELKKGAYRDEQIFGEDLVFFRNTEGKVSAFDAYCPHLGAKLTKGGQIAKDDCLVCPFHGWEFETDSGRCVKIPDIEDSCIPRNAKLKPWPVIERNGVVLIWNSKDRTPTYDIPEILAHTPLVLHGVSEHEIETIPQDLHENGPDTGHLNVVHVKGSMPFITHRFLNASWRPSEDPKTPYLAHVRLTEQAFVCGVRIRSLDTDITQHGPGVVLLTFTGGFMILVQTLKPVRLGVTVSYHMLYIVPYVPRFVAKIMFNEFLHLYEGDVVIWNNKKYLKSPMFVKTDRAIATFRKWYKQFYEDEEAAKTTCAMQS
jgi:cholesterol 7-dehydrogenase